MFPNPSIVPSILLVAAAATAVQSQSSVFTCEQSLNGQPPFEMGSNIIAAISGCVEPTYNVPGLAPGSINATDIPYCQIRNIRTNVTAAQLALAPSCMNNCEFQNKGTPEQYAWCMYWCVDGEDLVLSTTCVPEYEYKTITTVLAGLTETAPRMCLLWISVMALVIYADVEAVLTAASWYQSVLSASEAAAAMATTTSTEAFISPTNTHLVTSYDLPFASETSFPTVSSSAASNTITSSPMDSSSTLASTTLSTSVTSPYQISDAYATSAITSSPVNTTTSAAGGTPAGDQQQAAATQTHTGGAAMWTKPDLLQAMVGVIGMVVML